MNRLEALKLLALAISTLIATVLILVVVVEFLIVNKINITPEWSLSIVNAVTTTTLVIITALQMREARRARFEAVKPSLSLEPSVYHLGGGFMDLLLANSGQPARNVEIDVNYKKNTILLYISSVGTGHKVPVLMGDFPKEGGVVTVNVRFKDLYGNSCKDILSVDFDTINKQKRKFAYVKSSMDIIANKLDDIARQMR